MTTFRNGPAKGELLMLQNAPALLRVTLNQSGLLPTWDALDALTDTAAPEEFIYAYRRVGPVHSAHVRARGRCGWYRGAEYALVDAQPAPELLRNNRAWNAWVNSQVATDAP